MGLDIRKGRKDAAENIKDTGAIDESFSERRQMLENEVSSASRRGFQQDEEELQRFKEELAEGEGIGKILGIEQDLDSEQEASLKRLEDKWMHGMHGTYNAAEEERKPLMISFDKEDNIQATEVGSVRLLSNDFDGGEEIRLEYPGLGTEFYTLDTEDDNSWSKGRTIEETARNIASLINRHSRLVFASAEADRIVFELRDHTVKADSLVIFVDDPGEQDMVAEKFGVELDARGMTLQDYQAVIELALADGIITPSEDQMLWSMRQALDITEEEHVEIVIAMFGDDVMKECPSCQSMALLFPDYSAWYCEKCETWV